MIDYSIIKEKTIYFIFKHSIAIRRQRTFLIFHELMGFAPIGIMERWNDGKMGYGKLEEWFIDKIFYTMRFINDLDSLWLFGILEKWNGGKMGYGKLEKWLIGKTLFAKKFINDKFIIKIIIPIFHYSRNA